MGAPDNTILTKYKSFVDLYNRSPSPVEFERFSGIKNIANQLYKDSPRSKTLGLDFISAGESFKIESTKNLLEQIEKFKLKNNGRAPSPRELADFMQESKRKILRDINEAKKLGERPSLSSAQEGVVANAQNEAKKLGHVIWKKNPRTGAMEPYWPSEEYKRNYTKEMIKRNSFAVNSAEAKEAGVLSNEDFKKTFYGDKKTTLSVIDDVARANSFIPEVREARLIRPTSAHIGFSSDSPLNDMSRAVSQGNKNFSLVFIDKNNNLQMSQSTNESKKFMKDKTWKVVGVYDNTENKIFASTNKKLDLINNTKNSTGNADNIKNHPSYDEYVKFRKATQGVVTNLEKSIPQIFSEHNLSPKDKFNIYNYARSLGFDTGFANLHHMFGVKHSPTAGFQVVSGQANKQLNDFLFSKEKGIYTADGPWEKAERQKVLNEWAIKNNIIHFDTKGNSYGNPEHINAYNQNKFNPDMQAKILKDLIEDTVQQNSKTIVTEAKEIHKTQGQAAAIKYLNSNGFNPTDPDSFFKQSQKSLAKSLYQGIKNNATSFLKWGGKKFKVIPTAAAGADYGVSNLLFGMDPIASTLSAAQWTTPTLPSKQLLNTLMMYEESRRRYEEDMGPDVEPYHTAILSGKINPQFLEPHKELIEGGISGITKKEFGEIKESFAKDPVGFVLPLPERPELISMEDVKKQQLADWKTKGYKNGGQVKLNTADYIEKYGDGTELIHYKSSLRAITKQLD